MASLSTILRRHPSHPAERWPAWTSTPGASRTERLGAAFAAALRGEVDRGARGYHGESSVGLMVVRGDMVAGGL